MRQRYEVFDLGNWFASVHATTEDEAIEIACNVTDSRDPAQCEASPTRLVHTTKVPPEVQGALPHP